VDMFDQYRSYVKLDFRSRKYWHPLFWFIIESALINAWILYKTTVQKAGLPLLYNFFTFRKSIALALAAPWEKKGCRHKTTEKSPRKLLDSPTKVRVHLKVKPEELGHRYTDKDKHISYLCNIPNKEGSKLNKRQLYCKQCSKSRTVFWCSYCGVPLCKTPCFVLFHTEPEPQQGPNK
jgi:hypothetical protein